MSLDNALIEVQRDIPECVATGYVDMSSGLLLGVKTVDSHPSEVLDLVAAATADLFQGKHVIEIETLFDLSRGIEGRKHHYFNEIIILSSNLIHVFMRSKVNPDQAAVFVTRIAANIGMVLIKSRQAMARIEEEL